MKKNKSIIFLSFLFFSISLYGQVHFHSAEEAADFALSNSITYTYERANSLLAVKMANYSIESFLPTFSVSWADNKNKNFNSVDSSNKTLSLSMRQSLFDGGKNKLSYDMQKSTSLYNYNVYLQSEKNFRSDIIFQYYNCITSLKMLEIKRELESLAQEQLNILKMEYEMGKVLENDYLEYIISFKKIQNEQKQYEREYRAVLRKFKIALSLETDAEIILGGEVFIDPYEDFVLEDYFNYLWDRFKVVSPEYKQLNLNLQYAIQQYKYAKAAFIPEISLQADLNFSGTEYPLTSPSYNIKLFLSFSNFPLFPITIDGGVGMDSKGRLVSAKNNSSVSLSPNPNYLNTLTNQRISVMQQKENRKQSENSYYDSLFESISQFDDYNNNLIIYNDTIKIQEKRLLISQEQMNSGMMKRIDYLEELTDLARQKIELIQSQNNLLVVERSLEIMLDIPFGELQNVCKESCKK